MHDSTPSPPAGTDDRKAPPQAVVGVRQLNEAIQAALQVAFPQPIWVRGEIQRFPADAARRKHVYFELHESRGGGAADFQIPAAILGWDRDRHGLGRYLDGSDPGFQLRDQLEVCFLCRVDFYPPYGKVSVKVVGVDPAYTLGQLEARRREVHAALKAAGLLDRNRQVPLPDLPLRVGLITAAGSAAERDFRSGLERSGYPFTVDLVDCRMSGDQTAPQVIQALATLARRGVDVIAVSRGGGSRADLSWFDQQALCEAIALCPRPVVTGIGHEIDRSLADEVAHTACKTPTAAAEFLVERVRTQDERLRRAVERLESRVRSALEEAQRRVTGTVRLADLARRLLRDQGGLLRASGSGLESRVRRRVHAAGTRLAAAGGEVRRIADRRLAAADQRTVYLAGGLVREVQRARVNAGRRLEPLAGDVARGSRRRYQVVEHRLVHLDEKIRLLDPARLLARGFTLTLGPDGRLLRSAGQVKIGDGLRTRLPDGEIESTVTAAGRAPATPRRRPKGGSRGGEEDPGQQALF